MEGFQNDSSQPCVCIGSKLRLLSQLKVRYEGTLYSVDTNKSTISLKNVRTFGTEGRSVDGNDVPGSDEIFEIIVFRAADISEIFMIEAPTAVNVDPAIVDYQQTREKQNNAATVPPQREFPPGHNVTSVSDSRVSTPGPESVQSGGDAHHVPRHDVGHVGAKSVSKGWGTERGSNDRDHQSWGPSNRTGQADRRPAPSDARRDRDGYGERNGPYSAVDRKLPANNGNARPFLNQQHGGRSAGYGYNNDGGSRQTSARQPGYYAGQQGGSHYGHDQEHRTGGYRQVENTGRSGWREQRDRPEYQRGGRDGGGVVQRGYYNQRDGGDDRHQPQQNRRQQYVNAREPQQSQRGRGQMPQLHKSGQQEGGHRSRDRENQRDRDPQSTANSKNVPEFDFEKANEEFSKLDLNQAPKEDKEAEAGGNAVETNENKEGGAESTEPTYLKDSFFDDISRDSRQGQRPKTSERSLNMQTFGAAATRRRPATGRYYNRRPGNWTGTGSANGGEASTNGTAQVSA